MNTLKLIAIYGGLITVLALAHHSQFAGILYFGAAMVAMIALNTNANRENDTDAFS